jgi:L-rhamnose-proton symport protein (RhaT)
MEALAGMATVAMAGLVMGTSPWPFKVITNLKFEHIWFVGMLVGLVIIPWTVTLTCCPNVAEALTAVGPGPLLKANLFSVAWGIANVIAGLCFMRIGVALTGALMTGVGVSLGVTMPMLVKAPGLFENAPDLTSEAGLVVLAGVAVMLCGVAFTAVAGFGRDAAMQKHETHRKRFLCGLVTAVIGGILSCGISFAFVYSQAPIVEALTSHGASEVPASVAVWAAGLLGGALVNVLYPAFLMTRNKTWGLLARSWKETALAACLGVQLITAVVLMGRGMVLLGAMGASVGFGIQQGGQILGGQGLGFLSGEWRGVEGAPRRWMYAAIAALILASIILAAGNSMA